MSENETKTTNLSIRNDPNGYRKIRLVFGPHHYVVITNDHGEVSFELGCTHHGVQFDASIVDSELYKVIEFLRNKYPRNKTD